MDAAVKPSATQARCYQRRRPEQTLWYRTVQTHFETWLALADGPGDESTPAYIEQAFRRYLDCGILAKGFARAHCDECGHDFLIAFSCKGRGVCPSCNTRRMAETAAHLTDHVFPRLPVRQWVLSVPKRLRYFLQRDTALQGAVLRIFLRGVERCLREHSPGCVSTARIGAIAFIHRFGSSLNAHTHFHCCIVDGVFQAVAKIVETADTTEPITSVDFHAATHLDIVAIAQVQAKIRQRILRAFVRRGLISKGDRDEMLSWEHGGGFSLDASVCIGGTDRAGLERLLRYCARPPFALEHLHTLDAEHLLYHNPKPRTDSPRDLVLTPLELIDKIAALIPPPRAHRHRYYGVLAPNSPLRAAVTATAPLPVVAPPVVEVTVADAPPHRAASHYLWAMLLARIYETLPLVCTLCQSPMRIIAFITEGSSVRKILEHLGESTLPPKVAPARGPPLWEMEAAHRQAGNDTQWDSRPQPEPVFEFDQRVAW
ncbi:IS91 family transposase [Ferrigenium sp. UT5]|uniref:transposase n=1 Tax=Ferrigenium sp. UT5 TaxID=3242105 RepID=UPI00354C7C77